MNVFTAVRLLTTKFSCSKTFAAVISCALLASCDQGPQLAGSKAQFTVSDIGIQVAIGADSMQDWLGILHRPIDAAFSGDEIVILDSSAPWLRIYSRDGQFLRGIMRSGEGPGEAMHPFAVRASSDGGLIVTHSAGVTRLDQNGEPVWLSRAGPYWTNAAVEACGTHIYVLARKMGELGASALILRAVPNLELYDTLVSLGPMRLPAQVRRRHTSYVRGNGEGILLYPEELDRHRLLEIGCDGQVRRELEVAPLGKPESIGLPPPAERRPGRMAVRAAEPPLPGGLAHVGDHLLWSALMVDSISTERIDSLTIITVIKDSAEARQISVRGWYQLLDSDQEGMLLLADADALYPRVLLVDGNAILRLIDRHGTP
jgi:hypothetical protein